MKGNHSTRGFIKRLSDLPFGFLSLSHKNWQGVKDSNLRQLAHAGIKTQCLEPDLANPLKH